MSDGEALAFKFRRLVELREKRDSDKAKAETSEKEYRTHEAELFDEMADGPIQGTIRLDLGEPYGTVAFTPKETPFGRILDNEAAVKYFEEQGMLEEVTRQQFGKQKLNEIVRDFLDQGKPMPPGVDWYAKRGITISRSKR